MSARLLQFRCAPRLYVLPADGAPFDAEVDGFRIYEEVAPTGNAGAPENAVDYQIVAEQEVSSTHEVQDAIDRILDLANDLDRLWVYVTGAPIFYLQLTFEESIAPPRWETNAVEVRERLRMEEQGSTLTAKVGVENVSRRGIPFYPLREALSVRPLLKDADDRLRHLVELHYEALTSPGIHARLMMFSKAIELVHAMVEGSRADKESFLPDETGPDLRRRFRWLEKKTHGRRETRHVVTREDGTLHPQMTREERRDFVHDADLVIRDVVCSRLGREPFRVQGRE